MKSKNVCRLIIFFFLCGFNQTALPQDIPYCEMVGKSIGEVLKTYGKPRHHDKSNPAMECVFYQDKTKRVVFIGDKSGVYQVQADLLYSSGKEAQSLISKYLSSCTDQRFRIDTLHTGDYSIQKPGVKISLTLFENRYSNQFEIKIKADRSESR